jgi:hypothetical protein
MSVLSREVEYNRGRELRLWLAQRDWMLLCFRLDVGETHLGVMEINQSGHVFGKAFLTDRRLICTRLTAEGLYLPSHERPLASIDRVVSLPAEKILLLLTSPGLLDLILRARAAKVPEAEFERFTDLVRGAVAAIHPPVAVQGPPPRRPGQPRQRGRRGRRQ